MKSVRIAAVCVLCAAPAFSANANEVWSLDGFQAPETVLFDPANGIFYVSSIAGPPNDKDGNGFISKVSSDGTMVEAEWAKGGLDGPKGLALANGTLFVADIDRIVAVDVESGAIGDSWAAPGAQFLNDVAVDDAGRVFVSDMFTNRIYVLDDDTVSVFVEGPELLHPNGLHIDGGVLMVSGWGENIKDDFTTETPGRLVTVDLASKAISEVGPGTPVGNLDGLEPDGSGGWLATDWIAGALFAIDSDGNARQVLDLNQGSANFAYLPDEKLVVIPMMMEGRIVAYSVE